MVIEVEGEANVKKIYPDAISIFLLPPSMDVLKDRLINRGNVSHEDIEDRMKTAEREIATSIRYDYKIINDNLENAVKSLENIIKNNINE